MEAIIGILEMSAIDNASGSTRSNNLKMVIELQLKDTYHASSRQDILANPVTSA